MFKLNEISCYGNVREVRKNDDNQVFYFSFPLPISFILKKR